MSAEMKSREEWDDRISELVRISKDVGFNDAGYGYNPSKIETEAEADEQKAALLESILSLQSELTAAREEVERLSATPPGTELVPEGTMAAITDALELANRWLASNDCDCEMYHICGRRDVERMKANIELVITAHRATQKDKETT